MKKISSLILVLAGVTQAHAAATVCGYKDYFHVSSKTHPGVYIGSAASDYDLYLTVVGPRSFVIRDTELCTSGYAHVTLVDVNSNNYCVLDIKDGPYMMHPSVSASCKGLKFNGIKYDGFGSYSYTLKVD